MEKSLFIEWVNKNFKGITVRVVEKLNDSTNPLTYLHRRMLKKEYSVDGKWESISAAFTLVAAYLVAMDSSIPLANRDAIEKASGDIPKMGIELQLNEKQLTDLDTLIAKGGTDAQILAKLFADTPRVIGAIYERLESMFLEGLSSGVTIVDSNNTGTGVRLDYGYLTANKFGVGVLWSSPSTAKPFDDIQKVLDKASLDGNVISKIMLDRTAFNNLAKAEQTKELFAFYAGFVGANIPVPSLNKVNEFTNDRYGFQFEIVDRGIRTQKNGTPSTHKPWKDGSVVFLTSDQVGSLVYADLAELNHKNKAVEYSLVDDFILVSKYCKTDPSLSEITKSQARVVPVIGNVDQIYLLDSKTVQA